MQKETSLKLSAKVKDVQMSHREQVGRSIRKMQKSQTLNDSHHDLLQLHEERHLGHKSFQKEESRLEPESSHRQSTGKDEPLSGPADRSLYAWEL